MSNDTNKKPVDRFRVGLVTASIFENEREGKDGEKRVYSNVSLQRSYRDKDDQWQQHKISLDVNDLPKAILALQRAYESIVCKQDTMEGGA